MMQKVFVQFNSSNNNYITSNRYERVKEIRIKEYFLTGINSANIDYRQLIYLNLGDNVIIETDVIQSNGTFHAKIPLLLSNKHVIYQEPLIIANFQNPLNLNRLIINVVNDSNASLDLSTTGIGNLGIKLEIISSPIEKALVQNDNHDSFEAGGAFGLISAQPNKPITDLVSSWNNNYTKVFLNSRN